MACLAAESTQASSAAGNLRSNSRRAHKIGIAKQKGQACRILHIAGQTIRAPLQSPGPPLPRVPPFTIAVNTMLELRHLSKSYAHARPVLANLSCRFEAGEFIAIMGDSGVGKSTLLNLIAGLDTPDAGAEAHPILVDGIAMSSLDDAAATRLRRIKANGSCAIMVTHSLAAAEMADRTMILTKTGLQNTTTVNRIDQTIS
eukprot:gene22167-26601_t